MVDIHSEYSFDTSLCKSYRCERNCPDECLVTKEKSRKKLKRLYSKTLLRYNIIVTKHCSIERRYNLCSYITQKKKKDFTIMPKNYVMKKKCSS
jgi:hypothetical protein